MASAIRSAGELRHRLPRLLSSTTRSTARTLEEERQSLVRRAGLTAMGDARLFSSNAVGRSCTVAGEPLYNQLLVCYFICTPFGSTFYPQHPCKFNWGNKQHMRSNRPPQSLEGQLASISMAVKKDALGWRAIREQLEGNETKRAEVYKRQDRVVGYASAAVALALVAANVQSG